jgi:hypothetical protein
MSGEEGITIDVFEYELNGYTRPGLDSSGDLIADTEPQVFTSTLGMADPSNECSSISIDSESKDSKESKDSDTRSCDVLTGILSVNQPKPSDGTKVVNNFLSNGNDDMIISPESSSDDQIPPLHLSDLLYLTTQYATKIPQKNRPTRENFYNIIKDRTNLLPFYEYDSKDPSNVADGDFVQPLVNNIIDVLRPVWNTIHTTTDTELQQLKTNPPPSVPATLIAKLKSPPVVPSPPTNMPFVGFDIDNIGKNLIQNYTLVKSHTPVEGDYYFIVGDLHGSLATFVRLLYRWKIMGVLNNKGELQNGSFDDKNTFIPNTEGKKINILFLGDLSDRGVWGYEIYYTLFYLYLINEKNTTAGKVFITRGNHEEISTNIEDGFLDNMQSSFNKLNEYDYGVMYHQYINVALSYFPSAHRIAYPDASEFLYLAHGGYPLQTTKDCINPPVMPLEEKDIYFFDSDILAMSHKPDNAESNPNSIRWNNYHSINETTYFPDRGCAIGLNTINNAKKSGYFFTIRAHQDTNANTKVLMAPSENDPVYTGLSANNKKDRLDEHAPIDIHEVDVAKFCPNKNKDGKECKGPIATLKVKLTSEVTINESPQDDILPVLTISTNTDTKRNLFRDSFVRVQFGGAKKRKGGDDEEEEEKDEEKEDDGSGSGSGSGSGDGNDDNDGKVDEKGIPIGLSPELRTLYEEVHKLHTNMEKLKKRLQSSGSLKDCEDIKKYEDLLKVAESNLDKALKEYRKNVVSDSSENTSTSTGTSSGGVNAKLNGFTVKGKNYIPYSINKLSKPRYYRHERLKQFKNGGKPYLPEDIPVLVSYGFLKRSKQGTIVVPKEEQEKKHILDFLLWVTAPKQYGYPSLIAKWLCNTRKQILEYLDNDITPLRVQQALRDQLAEINAALTIGRVTLKLIEGNGCSNPDALSKASGFDSAKLQAGVKPPPLVKNPCDPNNPYYKQLIKALNELIAAYNEYIEYLTNCLPFGNLTEEDRKKASAIALAVIKEIFAQMSVAAAITTALHQKINDEGL